MAHAAEYLTALLATYLVHSSLILVAAMLFDRALGLHRAGLRLALWRAALLGPILTVLVQGALVSRPLGGTLRVFDSRAVSMVDRPGSSALHETPAFESASTPLHTPTARSGEALARRTVTVAGQWPTLVAVLWGLGMLMAGGRLAVAAWRLRQLMRNRVLRPSGRTARRLAGALGIRTPRLSTSHRLSIPFAVGLSRPEICLPERVATDLDRNQLEAVLAHEMAHLAARDPLWLLAYRLLQCALFVQPLNHLALRRLIDTSELCADARAVALTGDRRVLARSLVEVASWALPNHRALPVAAAATRASSLRRRVAQLLDGHTEYTMPKTAFIALFFLIALSVFALPSVTGSALVAEHDLQAVAAVAPAPAAATAAPQAPAQPDPATSPAPETAPAPPTAPDPPAPDHAYIELTAQRLEQLRLELEMLEDERRTLLEHHDLDPEAQTKLDEERARCRAEMAALQHELQEHLSSARDVARAAAAERRAAARRAETEERRAAARVHAAERDRERSAEARERELEARARAEELRRQEAERSAQVWTAAHEEALQKRLQELEARERALQLREEELQARERELARREREKTE